MKRFLVILFSVMSGISILYASGPDTDPKIAGLQARIDQLSEKGDYATVFQLRKQLADYAAGNGKYELAARQYELLLASRPPRAERVKLFTKLGYMRMALGDYRGAIAAYDDALHDGPKDWDANIARARAFAAAEINQRAIESYQQCIKLKPREAAPYAELGQVYEKQGFLGKALDQYSRALALEPKPETYLHMADCYVHQKNITEAIQILSQAKSRLPRAEYDVRLGEIYQNLGDIERASSAWEDAIRADPKRDDVKLRLALVYASNRHPQEADRLMRGPLSNYPDSPVVHYIHALVLLDRGDRGGAQKEAQSVQTLGPTELVEHYNDLLISELRKGS